MALWVFLQVPPEHKGHDAAPAAGPMDELVGRLALYPDDLVAVILPASTSPLHASCRVWPGKRSATTCAERQRQAPGLRRSGFEAAVAAGSARTAGSGERSHVLRALGVPARDARGALRFSLSRFTTEAEVDAAAAAVAAEAATPARGRP